jgi:hypothetical protein
MDAGMPCVIARPSIGQCFPSGDVQSVTAVNHVRKPFLTFDFVVTVIPIWKEPLPGWTDNINGPTGLLIGAGKGVIRTMYCDNNGYADYLPVDITVNGIILLTWNYIGNK